MPGAPRAPSVDPTPTPVINGHARPSQPAVPVTPSQPVVEPPRPVVPLVPPAPSGPFRDPAPNPHRPHIDRNNPFQ
ncbi:MAG: hypothetical protein U0325_31840 [Polyangiales bacterium]